MSKRLTTLKQRLMLMLQWLRNRVAWNKNENSQEVDESEDRHEKELETEDFISGQNRKGVIPAYARKYFFIAGVYLVTVTLLLVFFTWRLGNLSVELPDQEPGKPQPQQVEEGEQWMENENSQVLPGVEADDDQEALNPGLPAAVLEGPSRKFSDDQAGEMKADQEEEKTEQVPEETQNGFEEKYSRDFIENVESRSPVQERDDSGERPKEALMPVPASPLPSWSIHTPYGTYVQSVLSTGRQVHGTARGAVLQGTPAAAVSALWDGEVLQASGREGSGSCSVTIQHEGGYLTYYSGLNEVWVQQGQSIIRGEHLGRLPETPAPDKAVMAQAGVKGEKDRPREDESIQRTEPYEVQVHTVCSGYLQKDDCRETDEQSASASFPPGFENDRPLLYLEVIQGNHTLDPIILLLGRN